MRRSLRLLERSVTDGGKHKQRPPEGVASLGSLQEQIAVVRGQHIGKPTSSLRALESRVLGSEVVRSPLIPTYVEHETLRLDQEQLAPHHYPPNYAPTAESQLPAPVLPVAPPISTAANFANAWSVPSQAYSPEFSAPDTGRFQVESFADDFLGNSDGNGLTMPAMKESRFQLSGQAPSSIPAQRNNIGNGGGGNAPTFDDSNWISAAQNDRPAKISTASKQSLNPGLALAKGDFERELAAILGTGTVASTPAPDPLFADPNTTAQPAQTPVVPAKPTEPEVIHPNHNVFDQMGLAMRYANSFDLGNVSLRDRFEHFDRDLDIVHSDSHHSQPTQAQSMSNLFVDPMNLDEFDLVAELAEIGVDNPALTQVQTPAIPAQPMPAIESQQPTPTPAFAPDAAPAKPAVPLDIAAPIHSTNKPINRTETTAGDGHE